ncbi:MAG: transglycosylase SLT domain-containing protein [Uliginosibacterium sp.]|jgi:soluble lytic murein transglycosylase-like protein|nr:transglycosylase SLT domain-containing protein [Uliginosibacterium sp.]
MNYMVSLSRFARHAMAFVLHFVHGGFVMIGVIVIGSVGFLATQHSAEATSPRLLFAEYVERGVLARSEPAEDAEVVQAEPAESGLSEEQHRLVAAISKRHRVSPVMIGSLLKTIDREARANNLDPLLVLAVVTVESGFNPFAESVFGAQGLMQIIPKYHQEKISADKGVTALFDPAENIRVGSLIIKEYLRNTGSLETALQLYGGASSDPGMSYSTRVLNEKDRLKQIAMSSKNRMVSSRQAEPPAS